jgi:hypothetical protein
VRQAAVAASLATRFMTISALPRPPWISVTNGPSFELKPVAFASVDDASGEARLFVAPSRCRAVR